MEDVILIVALEDLEAPVENVGVFEMETDADADGTSRLNAALILRSGRTRP